MRSSLVKGSQVFFSKCQGEKEGGEGEENPFIGYSEGQVVLNEDSTRQCISIISFKGAVVSESWQ